MEEERADRGGGEEDRAPRQGRRDQGELPRPAPHVRVEPAGRGAEVVSIRELLGHSSVASSERYARLSNRRVKKENLQTIRKVIGKTRV